MADTGHHRILLVNKEGVVLNVIGGGEKYEAGFVDGSFQDARFHSPQGVTSENRMIYVADTENHAVRQVRIFKCPVLHYFVCLFFLFVNCCVYLDGFGVYSPDFIHHVLGL